MKKKKRALLKQETYAAMQSINDDFKGEVGFVVLMVTPCKYDGRQASRLSVVTNLPPLVRQSVLMQANIVDTTAPDAPARN